MAENIKYWSTVLKRILYVLLAALGIYLGYKCAVFYMTVGNKLTSSFLPGVR